MVRPSQYVAQWDATGTKENFISSLSYGAQLGAGNGMPIARIGATAGGDRNDVVKFRARIDRHLPFGCAADHHLLSDPIDARGAVVTGFHWFTETQGSDGLFSWWLVGARSADD